MPNVNSSTSTQKTYFPNINAPAESVISHGIVNLASGQGVVGHVATLFTAGTFDCATKITKIHVEVITQLTASSIKYSVVNAGGTNDQIAAFTLTTAQKAAMAAWRLEPLPAYAADNSYTGASSGATTTTILLPNGDVAAAGTTAPADAVLVPGDTVTMTFTSESAGTFRYWVMGIPSQL